MEPARLDAIVQGNATTVQRTYYCNVEINSRHKTIKTGLTEPCIQFYLLSSWDSKAWSLIQPQGE
jgi:hypothetical protein